jgi:hypothetical protein
MTRDEAASIRAAQLMGQAVREDRAGRAWNRLTRKSRRKWDFPTIPEAERAMLNAGLAFRLGLAIGRAHA